MTDLKKRITAVVKSYKRNFPDRKMIASMLGLTKASERIALAKALDDLEAEYVLFRGERNTYKTREQARMVEGVLHINRRGVGYIDQMDGPSILIDAELQMGAFDGDLVLVHISGADEERQKMYGAIYAILERRTSFLVGTLLHHGRSLRFVPDNEWLKERTFVMHFPANFKAEEGLKIIARIRSFEKPMLLEWEQTLGHRNDPGVDITSILLAHHIISTYSPKVLEEARACGTAVKEEELAGRIDLSGIQTITIDGEDARDFDDTISVEREADGWRLRVSIADVSHYVKAGSLLDQEAFKRGCSTYVTDRVVPMLPEELSNGICSLNPHVVRLTNTCDMHVKKDGTISACQLYASWICSKARMTYTEVNRFLEQDAKMSAYDDELKEMLINLRDCADAIRLARMEKGAIDFDTLQSQVICDAAGHPTSVSVSKRGHAERMIEDCMIAANVSVAHFMDAHKIPCVYRIHERPSEKRLREYVHFASIMGVPFSLKGEITSKRIQQYLKGAQSSSVYDLLASQMLRCMQKARYDEKDLGHFGLGEEAYLHFTSPIRRYPDLLVHRMLRKYSGEKAPKITDEDREIVQQASQQASMQERNAADAEFACMDMKKAEYMADHIGEVLNGTIVSVTAHGFYVALDNTIEGMVGMQSLHDDYYELNEERLCLVGSKHHAVYQVGQKVTVRVLAADKEKQTIDFGLVHLEGKPSHHRAVKTESFSRRRNNQDAHTPLRQRHQVAERDIRDDNKRKHFAFGKKKDETRMRKEVDHERRRSFTRRPHHSHVTKGKKYGGKGTH